MVKCFWGKENGGGAVDPTATVTSGVTPTQGAPAQQYSYGYGSMSYWYPQGYAAQGYMQGYPYHHQQYQYPTAGGQQYCMVPQQGQWTGATQPGQQPNGGPVMYATMQKYPTQ